MRLVFRVHIPQPSGRTLSLQVASNPIECCKWPPVTPARVCQALPFLSVCVACELFFPIRCSHLPWNAAAASAGRPHSVAAKNSGSVSCLGAGPGPESQHLGWGNEKDRKFVPERRSSRGPHLRQSPPISENLGRRQLASRPTGGDEPACQLCGPPSRVASLTPLPLQQGLDGHSVGSTPSCDDFANFWYQTGSLTNLCVEHSPGSQGGSLEEAWAGLAVPTGPLRRAPCPLPAFPAVPPPPLPSE